MGITARDLVETTEKKLARLGETVRTLRKRGYSRLEILEEVEQALAGAKASSGNGRVEARR